MELLDNNHLYKKFTYFSGYSFVVFDCHYDMLMILATLELTFCLGYLSSLLKYYILCLQRVINKQLYLLFCGYLRLNPYWIAVPYFDFSLQAGCMVPILQQTPGPWLRSFFSRLIMKHAHKLLYFTWIIWAFIQFEHQDFFFFFEVSSYQ